VPASPCPCLCPRPRPCRGAATSARAPRRAVHRPPARSAPPWGPGGRRRVRFRRGRRPSARGRRRSRTGTEASLTVRGPPWQNQTAGRDRGPAGGSSDACLHPRGGRRPPRNGAGTRHHHASRPPLPRLTARGSSPRRRRRDFVRVHGLRPQLELIDGCPQAEVRLVRQRHADRA